MEKNKVTISDVIILLLTVFCYIAFQIGRSYKEPSTITIKCEGINAYNHQLSNSSCLSKS